jgi:hypothetical protein
MKYSFLKSGYILKPPSVSLLSGNRQKPAAGITFFIWIYLPVTFSISLVPEKPRNSGPVEGSKLMHKIDLVFAKPNTFPETVYDGGDIIWYSVYN